MENHKKTLLIALVIALVVVGALVFTNKKFRSSLNVAPEKITRTDLPINKVPEGFPTEVPLEKDAKLIYNFEANTSAGRHQATRTFASKKTIPQNYQLYLDFFTQNSWQITGQTESPDLSSIFASKSNGQLAVNIAKNKLTGVITVDLSWVK